MRTPHKVLHEVLTKEEYKQLCRVSTKDILDLACPMTFPLTEYPPSLVLHELFLWESSPQGQGYWESIYDRLLTKEQEQ